jgi:hypothetical protein
MRRILAFAATATTEIQRRRSPSKREASAAADDPGSPPATAAHGADGGRHRRVWWRPRAVAAATFGALLLSWGTASALSGPQPVPDTYGGELVLTYDGQSTQVFNVSGCDLGVPSTPGPTAFVKPCQFEVPANAAPTLTQKILGALGSGTPPSSNTYTLTHYRPDQPGGSPVSDYAAKGNFTISRVTLPVLAPLDPDGSLDHENLGIQLTPVSGAAANAGPVGPDKMPLLSGQTFDVDTEVPCGSPSGPTPVVLNPPVLQIPGFTTTPLRSLAVSIDTTTSPVTVNTGPVRISQSDTTEINTARSWLANPQPQTLTVNMATYDCTTATYSNRFKMSLPVLPTSMDPFPRTDGFFTLGLKPAGRPTVSWQ